MRDLCSRPSEEAASLENRGVLDRGCYHVSGTAAGMHGAHQCKVVGLGAAGGEDDFFWLSADQRGDLRACSLNCCTGSTAFLVQARRISKGAAEKWAHRRKHPGIKRGGGGMIKINARIHECFSSMAALGPARPKNTNASSGMWGRGNCSPKSHVPRKPGGNLHHMIRLVPDPVVLASAGPLPSATLHE